MAAVSIEREVVVELLARRDQLVRAITAGTASGDWNPVMPAFDGLLAAIQRFEETAGGV
jgi:hypothetical protein